MDYQDIRSQIGGRAHFERSMPWGSTSLTASAGWERLHDDSRDPVIAVTAGGLGSIAPINLNEDDLVNVGARVAANIHGRVAVAGEYEGTFGNDYEQNAVRGRVRIGF